MKPNRERVVRSAATKGPRRTARQTDESFLPGSRIVEGRLTSVGPDKGLGRQVQSHLEEESTTNCLLPPPRTYTHLTYSQCCWIMNLQRVLISLLTAFDFVNHGFHRLSLIGDGSNGHARPTYLTGKERPGHNHPKRSAIAPGPIVNINGARYTIALSQSVGQKHLTVCSFLSSTQRC